MKMNRIYNFQEYTKRWYQCSYNNNNKDKDKDKDKDIDKDKDKGMDSIDLKIIVQKKKAYKIWIIIKIINMGEIFKYRKFNDLLYLSPIFAILFTFFYHLILGSSVHILDIIKSNIW